MANEKIIKKILSKNEKFEEKKKCIIKTFHFTIQISSLKI